MKIFSGFLGVMAMGLVACGGSTPPASDPSTAASPSSAAGAPEGKDSDADGVADTQDKCPDKKEDGQGAEPKDGCPKP